MQGIGEAGQAPRSDVFGRYALPGRRYKRLMSGTFLDLPPAERAAFGKSLAMDAWDISDAELDELFEGDWRERLTGAWLAAVGLRVGFRDLIASRLIAGERYTGKAYAFALASFGEPVDAEALAVYLRQSLPLLELRSDQPWALGALMVLDMNLRTDYASEFIGGDGVWERWVRAGVAATFTAGEMKETLLSWCVFADDCRRSRREGDDAV